MGRLLVFGCRDPREQLTRCRPFLGGDKGTHRQAGCLEIDRPVGLDAFQLFVGVRRLVPVATGEGGAHFPEELLAEFDLFFFGHGTIPLFFIGVAKMLGETRRVVPTGFQSFKSGGRCVNAEHKAVAGGRFRECV